MGCALTPDELRRVALFARLAPDQLVALAGGLRVATVAARTTLMTVAQPGRRVYVILSGAVKVGVEHADGREVVLALLGPGDVVGEMSLVDQLDRSASVTTLEVTALAWMDGAAFRRQLQTIPHLLDNLMTLLSRRLRRANARLQANATLDVEGRVALQLLALAHDFGERAAPAGVRIPLRLSQTDLAALVAASRVRVNQVMVDYQRRGYIGVGRDGRITVLECAALERRVGEALLDPARLAE
ncbi:MAG TPA: Crp/Fnr family transcriptional regulator [Thermomicrobiales bacterium]|nr:Crp/Fnr family transcriptional regulator [Thermomicrobiales bacterium]